MRRQFPHLPFPRLMMVKSRHADSCLFLTKRNDCRYVSALRLLFKILVRQGKGWKGNANLMSNLYDDIKREALISAGLYLVGMGLLLTPPS
jgi:hypothetical protein